MPTRLRNKLDDYYREIHSVIVRKQHPVTGLLPASTAVTVHGDYRDAWVRDNVYSILAVWALGLAYRQLDDDEGRGVELRQRTVHLMRGLLRSMMAQSRKVEAFKQTRRIEDALHAKYDTETGGVVVGDGEWGHLQIDATSLYLLMLAQMISSGLCIIWTQDEVNFVQNLVYYIERAYRTPDYGIWERGAKSNRGAVEINASSVGLAKAALEALDGFNLFGARGSQAQVLHVNPDSIAQAGITLSAMLPRESNTKETDAALLCIVGYPGYAIRNSQLSKRVRNVVIGKLKGKYGLKRFLLDGHQTVVEDENRLHYEPEELKRFENVESEWPLFFAFLYLDGVLLNDTARASEYGELLAQVLVDGTGDQVGQRLLPELYYVPQECVEAERLQPGSQPRVPNDNVPLVWAQSLLYLGRMLDDGLLQANDIDPLGRRHLKLPRRPIVQILLLVEDDELQAELAAHGVATQTLDDIAPMTVFVPEDIVAAYAQVGRNDGLGLTGRVARAIKTLTTSRLYRIQGQVGVCLASFFLQRESFLASDLEFLVQRFESELAYVHQHWTQTGRPTVTVLLTRDLLEADRRPLYELVQRISTGRVGSVPVKQGRLSELTPTACVERIDQLNDLLLNTEPILSRLTTKSLTLPEPGEQLQLRSSDELAIETTTSLEALVLRLGETHNLYEQIELLESLVRLRSMSEKVPIAGTLRSLSDLIEEVYQQASRLRSWAVVRRAAGLLGKVDGDINIAVGAILAHQKVIQVGRAYSEASFITQPIPDDELLDKINTFCRDDVRDRVLTQEVLLYVSLLIKAQPELFADLLTIRVSHLILLMSSELARERNLQPAEGYDALTELPPSVVQTRLRQVISEYFSIQTLPQQLERHRARADREVLDWTQDLGLERIAEPAAGWLVWRQHMGVVDRRPPRFYEYAWEIFRHVDGLTVGDKLERRNRMKSSIVLGDMTPGEKAFALWLEHLLSKIVAPEYRHLNVEALCALSSFFRQNPSLHVDGTLSLDALIGHAVRSSFLTQHPQHEAEYMSHKSEAWHSFYTASPETVSEHMVIALRRLLTVSAEPSDPHAGAEGPPSSLALRQTAPSRAKAS